MSLNRVVVLLTPIFAALAGWLTEWVAQHLPGTPNLDKGQLTVLFVAGSTFAFGKAALWLHGWQQAEGYDAHTRIAALHAIGDGQEFPGATEGVKHDTFDPPLDD